ncbi:NRX4 protein, partial [Acromyrmex insinuator]
YYNDDECIFPLFDIIATTSLPKRIQYSDDGLAWSSLDYRFRFKTNNTDGVLMYSRGTQSDYYIALQLHNNKLILNSFFIDRVLIKGRRSISLTVDLNREFYIGGVPNKQDGLVIVQNFTGCIENFYLNSMNIICELKETKIINENLRYYKINTQLYTYPEPSIISVTFLTFVNPNNPITHLDNFHEKFNDEKWHQVILMIAKNSLILNVNRRSMKTEHLLDMITGSYYFICGTIGSESNHDFVGCMRMISIDGNYKLPTDWKMVDRCPDEKEGRHTLGPLICEGDDLFKNVVPLEEMLSTCRPLILDDSGDIYFEFKITIQAVIIYSKGSTNYIKVSIHNGNQIYFQYVIGGGPLTVSVSILHVRRKKARIVIDGAMKNEVREPPGPVRARRGLYGVTESEEAFRLGQYHNVRIGRKKSGAILILQIDNYEIKEFEFNIKHSADTQFNNIQYMYIGIKETRSSSQVNEEKVRAVYNETDTIILESVLAVILIALVIMTILTGHQVQKKKEWFI